MMQTKDSPSLVDKAEENVASVSVPDARPILTPPTLLVAKQSAEDEEQKHRIERAAAKRLRKLACNDRTPSVTTDRKRPVDGSHRRLPQ